jgi:SAM-dependent methyltransferase
VPIARRRLEPLGIEVVQAEPARDNIEQGPGEASGRLPFPDCSFQLVVSRHESFVAAELARVLGRGGRFLTQQMSPGGEDFARLLGMPGPEISDFRLELASRQLEAAGFRIAESAEGEQTFAFADVGALAWYLKAVPWALPGFTPEGFREPLHRLHESGVSLRAGLYAFWLDAVAG